MKYVVTSHVALVLLLTSALPFRRTQKFHHNEARALVHELAARLEKKKN
jgi:hypothetical protein